MKNSININEFQKTIESKKDFEEFLRLLKDDFQENKEGWDNDNLELFLDGLYGYNYVTTEDESKIQPTWKLVAEMLLAARVYE